MAAQEELELPGHLRGLFDNATGFLAEFIDLDKVLLGGGTVLAARWQHRQSFDIDLFMDPAVFETAIFHKLTEFEDRLAKHPFGQISSVGSTGCTIIGTPEGRVDIVGSRPTTGCSWSAERVAGSPVHAETTAEILAKKLHRRMLEQGRVVPRDLYDIAVARQVDPGALETAWAAEPIRSSGPLLACLNSFGARWMERQDEPVIQARYPRLERNAVAAMLDDIRTRTAAIIEMCGR